LDKEWGLNAIRGGKFGIGWTMNQKLWPDADKVDYPLIATLNYQRACCPSEATFPDRILGKSLASLPRIDIYPLLLD
jgi:hypothetical protein